MASSVGRTATSVTGTGLTLTPGDDHPSRVAEVVAHVGERVGLAGVLGDLDRVAAVGAESPPGRVFGWDEADSTTTTWWPQGLTTSGESAHSASELAARTVVFAAWYAKDRSRRPDRAVRVSVLDVTDQTDARYTHVLLVEPQRRWRVGPWQPARVMVHAGGLVWLDHLLLVTDTWRGFRVFDLRDLVRVNPGPRTYGYRYLLPQRGRWRAGADGAQRALRWSFASLDRQHPGEGWLIAGEYVRGGKGARLARFPMAPLLSQRPAEAADVVTTDVPSMQGAARVDGRYCVSASHGSHRRGHLWVGSAEAPFRKYPEALPIGPEDLSYDPAVGRLWTQTEHPGQRLVLSVPLPSGS